VGAKPYGATAATVRPDTSSVSTVAAMVAALGVSGPLETTYCIGNCACGHEL
jgi:hypothetical protein